MNLMMIMTSEQSSHHPTFSFSHLACCARWVPIGPLSLISAMSSLSDSQQDLGQRPDSQDDAGDDSWLSVAEQDNESAQKLSQDIMALDAIVSDSDADTLSDKPSKHLMSASDRVARFQKKKDVGSKTCLDDPFWIDDFWTITELVDETVSEDGRRTLQEPMNIVSGCSGLLAEAWVCKVRWVCHVITIIIITLH